MSIEQGPEVLELGPAHLDLADRTSDGVTYTLWQTSEEDTVKHYVTVDDYKRGRYFAFDVIDSIDALHAFYHPYSYMHHTGQEPA